MKQADMFEFKNQRDQLVLMEQCLQLIGESHNRLRKEAFAMRMLIEFSGCFQDVGDFAGICGEADVLIASVTRKLISEIDDRVQHLNQVREGLWLKLEGKRKAVARNVAIEEGDKDGR